ncbi:MAG: Dabb family protein [Leptospiraceae bacterium]|nr:Dabb family protein [Leptospiraceae bacterium]MCP5500989.1 Dabb family protein [Leptospiraceae bacterium]
MVKHVVMWKVKDTKQGTKEENIQKAKELLEALKEKITAISSLQVGLNFSTRPVAFDLVLITEHKDMEALKDYQEHPEHKKVADFIGEVKLETAVVDFTY